LQTQKFSRAAESWYQQLPTANPFDCKSSLEAEQYFTTNAFSRPSLSWKCLGRLNFWGFSVLFIPGKPMHSNLITDRVAFTGALQPIPLCVAPRLDPTAAEPRREPIRHLLIGSPALVQHTIHQLHNLHYAEASLWSPELALNSTETMLTLNPGEVLRILLRYVAIAHR
jgi:hypothetical protein